MEAIFNVFQGEAETAAEMLKSGMEQLLNQTQGEHHSIPIELSAYAIEMARDLAQAYKNGEMGVWAPPIAVLKKTYFGGPK